jgi:CheY-like chemotaxis protein
LNVLLAEDNPVNQEIAAGLLEMLGCTVTVVENGRQAVDAARRSTFDLVFMDCEMPVMDGFAATRAIRADGAGGARLPIIALTARDAPEARTDCLAAGMDDLLGKPFSRADLASLIEHRRPSPGPPASPASTSADGVAQTMASALDPVAIDALRALDPQGERHLLQRAITTFAAYSDELIARLAAAAEAKDVTEIARLAHSLKSSSANLGATDLAGQCADLERRAKDGGFSGEAGPWLSALQTAQRTARRALLELIGAG